MATTLKIAQKQSQPSPKVRAPRHLKPTTRRWWYSVVADYEEFEEHHRLLLTAAAEAWDRYQAARAVIDHDGVSYLDRFNCPRARPEVAVERDSRIAFARLVRELALDVEPPSESPRPPTIAGRR